MSSREFWVNPFLRCYRNQMDFWSKNKCIFSFKTWFRWFCFLGDIFWIVNGRVSKFCELSLTVLRHVLAKIQSHKWTEGGACRNTRGRVPRPPFSYGPVCKVSETFPKGSFHGRVAFPPSSCSRRMHISFVSFEIIIWKIFVILVLTSR